MWVLVDASVEFVLLISVADVERVRAQYAYAIGDCKGG